MVAAALCASSAFSASLPTATGAASAMVITARPPNLQPGELTVMVGKNRARVVGLERLSGDLAGMQLFVLLDDSTRSTSLSLQLPELKTFIASLPPSTEVAVGYMRYGSFLLSQGFTADHAKAADSLRLPLAAPGENGSPYFALSDLAKHWPSKQPTQRRAVLMLTDGIDRYWGSSIPDDPYEDTAIRETLKNEISVYSIYLRGAGMYDRAGWPTLMGQSHLIQATEETGGFAYFQDFTDPVTIQPFLKDFRDRLENQYKVTIEALNQKGVQPVKVHTEAPGVKIDAPTEIYIR